MRYVEVSKEELQNLRPALSLLERVNHETESVMADYTLYGITQNPNVLKTASEEVAYGDSTPQLHQIALAVPLSSDILYYLTGSGLKVGHLAFAYFGEGSEGILTESFFAQTEDKVTLDDFQHLAVADGDVWLDDYLQKHGQEQTPASQEVQRDAEATLEAVEDTQPAESTPVAPPVRRPTSAFRFEGVEDWFLQ